MAAAIALFEERGYDDTTVDDIAAAAGVGRRTFFRYFPSKEDAVALDHDAVLARVAEMLENAHPDEPTTALLLRAGEAVMDRYAEHADLSVRRHALTHGIPALRDRESARVDHYRRLFTRHLRRRFSGDADGDLRAAVTGAAVVAAHNLALRTWLAEGAPRDGEAACRARFRRVAALLVTDADGLRGVTERLEVAVGRLERSTPG
jgi:AcrR family transcriptional regulator